MTGSTLIALAANPASSLETGLIGIRFKHSFFVSRIPSVLYCQQCSLLPTLPSTVSTAAASATTTSAAAASPAAASPARNTWTSNFSSITQSFVPLRFTIFFTQKYLSLNPLMEHHLPLTDEQWVKLEPLILSPESSAPALPCSRLFKHSFFECRLRQSPAFFYTKPSSLPPIT